MSNLEKKEPGERDENSGSGQENEPTSEELQELMRNLEIVKRPCPDWVRKTQEANIKRLEGQIAQVKDALKDRRIANKVRRESVVEKFGPETLEEADLRGIDMQTIIEKHLLKADNKEEAGKILALWVDLVNAMDAELSKTNPERIENELGELIGHIRKRVYRQPRAKK